MIEEVQEELSENKDNKLTLINEKTANDYLTHTKSTLQLKIAPIYYMIMWRI